MSPCPTWALQTASASSEAAHVQCAKLLWTIYFVSLPPRTPALVGARDLQWPHRQASTKTIMPAVCFEPRFQVSQFSTSRQFARRWRDGKEPGRVELRKNLAREGNEVRNLLLLSPLFEAVCDTSEFLQAHTGSNSKLPSSDFSQYVLRFSHEFYASSLGL